MNDTEMIERELRGERIFPDHMRLYVDKPRYKWYDTIKLRIKEYRDPSN